MTRRSGFPPALASLALLLLSACGGGGDSTTDIPNPPEPPTAAGPQAKATIGAGGGQVAFSDGRLKLIVPAGALSASTEITVTELTGSDIPTELQGLGVKKTYQFEPDGLQFATPAQVEEHFASLTPDSVPIMAFVSDSKGTLTLLDSARVAVDSLGLTATVPVRHFSDYASLTEQGVYADLNLRPSQVLLNSPFTIDLSVGHSATSKVDALIALTLDPLGPVSVNQFDPPSVNVTDGQESRENRSAAGGCLGTVGKGGAKLTLDGSLSLALPSYSELSHTFFTSYELKAVIDCVPPPPTIIGLADLTVHLGGGTTESVGLTGVGPLTTTFTSSDQSVLPDANILTTAGSCMKSGGCEFLLVPNAAGTTTVTVAVSDTYGHTVSDSFTLTVVDTPGLFTVSYGLQSPPGTATEMETITVIGPLLGNLSGDLLTMVSDGSGGYVIWDLPSGQVLRNSGYYSGGMTRGAVPISGSPVGPDAPAGVFVYRQGDHDAVIDNYDPSTQKFTKTPVSSLIVDATNAGGSLTSTEMLLVAPTIGVESLGPLGDGTFGLTGRSIPATDIGGYGIRAAVEMNAGGAVLVGSAAPNVGVEPTNGTLYYIAGTNQALAVGPIGIEPRKMRCLPEHDLCAVTGNSDNSLTLIDWNGIDVPTILGPVTVGDGPVGLDMAALDNGNTLIVTTGFNDNTYTLTEVAPEGTVVSNVTQPVDTGCMAPVGVALFDDAEGKKVITTCFWTYKLDVLPTAAPGS